MVAVVSLVGGSCSSKSSSPTMDGVDTAGSRSTVSTSHQDLESGSISEATIVWEPCANDLECTTVPVPLDYAEPSRGTFDLAVARQPARKPDERLGVLLVNPGGPGASGIEYLRDSFRTSSSVETSGLADRFDLVSWDPRGVGASSPLRCGGAEVEALRAQDPSPDDGDEQRELDDAARAVARECQREDADLLPFLGTRDVIADLDQIRVGLGEEQISYLGFSYGTLIGLEYLRAHPGHLRALAIDGVVDPSVGIESLLSAQARALDRVLADTFTTCAARHPCPVEDPAATYDRIAADVETTPLPSSKGDAVTPMRLAYAAISSAYSPNGADRLLSALATADQGDGTGLARLADAYFGSVAAFTTYIGVTCVDGPHPDGADEWRRFSDQLAAISPRFGEAVANELLPCAFWPVEPTRTPAAATDAGGPKVLVIGTTGDAATPIEGSRAVVEQLGNATMLTLHGAGHTAFGQSSCVAEAVGRYLIDLDLPEAASSCP